MKKLLIYGDSLSSGTHGNGAYLKQLENNLKISLTNRSIGSSGLSVTTPNCMIEQIEKYHDVKYDIILIWHGTNDWYWGTPMDLFTKSIEKVITILRERNPEAMIVWAGPLYRFETPNGTEAIHSEANFCKNKEGFTLSEYTNILEKKTKEFHVKWINIDASTQITQFNSDVFLEDKVHPNAKGYERIAKCLTKEIAPLLDIQVGE